MRDPQGVGLYAIDVPLLTSLAPDVILTQVWSSGCERRCETRGCEPLGVNSGVKQRV